MSENEYWTKTKTKFSDERNLEVFKTWNSVLSVPLYSYFQFEHQYGVDVGHKIFGLSKEQQEIWKPILKEPFLGHTKESYNQVQKFLNANGENIETSPWALKCAHHVLSYIIHTGKDILDYDQIIEFGPGIGETCRIINDLGYKKKYYLYDLEEVLRVSSFYNSKYPNVKSITHYSQALKNKKTLFIATWSVSEAPLEYRDEIFYYFKDADYLIVYQNKAFEYDNKEYFKSKFPKIVDRQIKEVNIDWLDHIAEGNKYLFC